jgi:hypothetical protein
LALSDDTAVVRPAIVERQCQARWEPLWCLDAHCPSRHHPEHLHRCQALSRCRFCVRCELHCRCVDVELRDLEPTQF